MSRDHSLRSPVVFPVSPVVQPQLTFGLYAWPWLGKFTCMKLLSYLKYQDLSLPLFNFSAGDLAVVCSGWLCAQELALQPDLLLGYCLPSFACHRNREKAMDKVICASSGGETV